MFGRPAVVTDRSRCRGPCAPLQRVRDERAAVVTCGADASSSLNHYLGLSFTLGRNRVTESSTTRRLCGRSPFSAAASPGDVCARTAEPSAGIPNPSRSASDTRPSWKPHRTRRPSASDHAGSGPSPGEALDGAAGASRPPAEKCSTSPAPPPCTNTRARLTCRDQDGHGFGRPPATSYLTCAARREGPHRAAYG